MLFKKNNNSNNRSKNKLIRNIKVIYNIGSKSHEKEFKAYALLGIWMVNNWRRIKLVDISLKDEEEKRNGSNKRYSK